jgi:hypothetical protein
MCLPTTGYGVYAGAYGVDGGARRFIGGAAAARVRRGSRMGRGAQVMMEVRTVGKV